ncbi:MAG: hypothetical protein JWM28_3544 [Chitinophagaceae bacterium]|nr:hypothetical protein [Chitinophagaceae bacterium]
MKRQFKDNKLSHLMMHKNIFHAKGAKKQRTQRDDVLRIHLYFLNNSEYFTQRAPRSKERKEMNRFSPDCSLRVSGAGKLFR